MLVPLLLSFQGSGKETRPMRHPRQWAPMHEISSWAEASLIMPFQDEGDRRMPSCCASVYFSKSSAPNFNPAVSQWRCTNLVKCFARGRLLPSASKHTGEREDGGGCRAGGRHARTLPLSPSKSSLRLRDRSALRSTSNSP